MRIASIGIVAAVVLSVGQTKADFTFGEPVNLGPTVNSSSGEGPDFVSYDGLEMYFDSRRSGGYGNWDIWVSRRETNDDDWGEPENLGPTINTSQGEACAYISADGLELYFSSGNRPGGYGNGDIWVFDGNTYEVWGGFQDTGCGGCCNKPKDLGWYQMVLQLIVTESPFLRGLNRQSYKRSEFA